MPFITEQMPEEAKANLPFRVCRDFNGKRPTLSRWVIDKDRKAYVVLVKKVGGSFEGTQETKHYILNWRSKLIAIRANPLKATFDHNGATMHWEINKLTIPDDLTSSVSELQEVIKQAFRAIGKFFDGHNYFDVKVVFRTNIA